MGTLAICAVTVAKGKMREKSLDKLYSEMTSVPQEKYTHSFDHLKSNQYIIYYSAKQKG